MKLDFDNKEYLFGTKSYPDTSERNEMLERLKAVRAENIGTAGKKDGMKVTLVTVILFVLMVLCFIFVIGGIFRAALAVMGIFFTIAGLMILTDNIDDKTDNSLVSSRIFSIPFLSTGILLIICGITDANENLLMMFFGFVFLFVSAVFFSRFAQQYAATHLTPNAEVVGYVWKASDADAPMPFLVGTPLFEFNLYGELYRAFDPKYMNTIIKEKTGERCVIKIDRNDPYKIRCITKVSEEENINSVFILFGCLSGLPGIFLLLSPLFF